MKLHEAGLVLAHTLAFKHGSDVALLVRADSGTPEGWALGDSARARDAKTACVHAMQAQAEVKFGKTDYYLYTTALPTPMCLGMAKRCHVKQVLYIADGSVVWSGPEDVVCVSHPLGGENLQFDSGKEGERFRQQTLNLTPVPQLIAQRRWGELEGWLKPMQEADNRWANPPMLPPAAAPRFFGPLEVHRSHGASRTPLRDKIYMTLTFSLLHTARTGTNAAVGELGGQQIAAVLVGPDGRFLSWGVNTNTRNITRHGETNCVQCYLENVRAPVPDGSTLYTTLQSCEMCAGMLATVGKDMRVVYGAADLAVGDTALKRGLNGCREERFAGAGSNPVARAQFRLAVTRAAQRRREGKIAEAEKFGGKLVETLYPLSSLPNDKRKAHGKAYGTFKDKAAERYAAEWSRVNPSQFTGVDVSPLPGAVTGALSSTWGMSSIAAYSRIYEDLGVMLTARYQCHPRRDHMGFTWSELKRIVEDDERRMPMLSGMIDADMEIWKEGKALLVKVAQAALVI
jgi:tRNA(Arg) A34 adenosine deaminase TadA